VTGGVAAVGSLKDLQDLLEEGQNMLDHFPHYTFFSVLIYAPINALNQKLHEYVVSHSHFLHRQTGSHWLVFVVEDLNRDYPIDEFRPDDVYDIARYLGAEVKHVPGTIFFTEPKERNETLVVSLSRLLPPSDNVTDEVLTNLFGKITTIIDSCSEVASDRRLECLRREIESEWPQTSSRHDRTSEAVEWLKTSAAQAATVAGALTSILTFLRTVGFPF
jgi:hypothetical protein